MIKKIKRDNILITKEDLEEIKQNIKKLLNLTNL